MNQLLKELFYYAPAFENSIQNEKKFNKVKELDIMSFIILEPEIVNEIEKMDLSIELKKDIFKDLSSLELNEQNFLFNIFKEFYEKSKNN
jgi:hypothetical protein